MLSLRGCRLVFQAKVLQGGGVGGRETSRWVLILWIESQRCTRYTEDTKAGGGRRQALSSFRRAEIVWATPMWPEGLPSCKRGSPPVTVFKNLSLGAVITTSRFEG